MNIKDSISETLDKVKSKDKGGSDKKKGKKKTNTSKKKKEIRDRSRRKPRGDITEDFLYTAGMTYSIPHIMRDGMDDLDVPGRRKKAAKDVAVDLTSHARKHAGIWDIEEKCHKYGYPWEEVMQGKMDGGYGDNIEKDDAIGVLRFILNVLLRANATRIYMEEKLESSDKDKYKAKYHMASKIEKKIDDIISDRDIQTHCDRLGIDFSEVAKWIMEKQDEEDLIEG